jgi:hypothetical protein
MSYLVANIPPIEVFIKKEFLYDFHLDEKGKLLGKEEFLKRWENLIVTALAVLPNPPPQSGQSKKHTKEDINKYIDGYDGLDKQISKEDINTFTNIIGIS